MFALYEWKDRLGDSYPLLSPYLVTTKHKTHSYPCKGGCLRQTREYNGKIYGVCSEDEKACDDIILPKQEIIRHKFDISSFTTDLIKKASGIPLKPAINQPLQNSLIYHVSTYSEDDNPERKLHLYFSVLSKELNAITISQIQSMHGDFVVLVAGDKPLYLKICNAPLAEQIIEITPLLKNRSDTFLANLHRVFSELLALPITPPMNDKTIQDYNRGHKKRLDNIRHAHSAGKENTANAKVKWDYIRKIALSVVKNNPKKHSASQLAKIILTKLYETNSPFKSSESSLRQHFSKDNQIRALLKPHRK